MLVIDEIFKKSEESTAVCSRIAIMIIQKKKQKKQRTIQTNGQKRKKQAQKYQKKNIKL